MSGTRFMRELNYWIYTGYTLITFYICFYKFLWYLIIWTHKSFLVGQNLYLGLSDKDLNRINRNRNCHKLTIEDFPLVWPVDLCHLSTWYFQQRVKAFDGDQTVKRTCSYEIWNGKEKSEWAQLFQGEEGRFAPHFFTKPIQTGPSWSRPHRIANMIQNIFPPFLISPHLSLYSITAYEAFLPPTPFPWLATFN